jgi:very-short-patch-repair endonuclease
MSLKKNLQDEKPPTPPLRRDRARGLRHSSTDAERILWARLRNRQVMDAKFRRQYQIGPYFADFFCLESKLVIELDGGDHDTDEQRSSDSGRTAYLESRGYRVVRFWNNEINENLESVIERIRDFI